MASRAARTVLLVLCTPFGFSSPPGGPRIWIAPGVDMPLASNGYMTLDHPDGNATAAGVEAWLRAGGRGLDTAYGYGTQAAYGQGLRQSGVARDEVFLTTKIPCIGSTEEALNLVKESVKELGTYADLIIIHGTGLVQRTCFGDPFNIYCQKDKHAKGACCDSMEQIQATYRGLELALQQNLTRAIGVSNFHAEHMEAVLASAKVPPAVNQGQLYAGHHDDESMEYAKKHNITWMAYSPLGPIFVSPKAVLVNDVVKDVAQARNVSAAQVGLAWIAKQGVPFVTSTNSAEHTVSDLAVLDIDLSESEMKRLSAITCTVTSSTDPSDPCWTGAPSCDTCTCRPSGAQVMQCYHKDGPTVV